MRHRKRIAVLWISFAAVVIGFSSEPAPATSAVGSAKKVPSLIALTSAATGQVFLLDRNTLGLVRTVEPAMKSASAGPMLVAEDKERRAFYVGNHDSRLERIPMDGGRPRSLDLGGVLIGVGISPDGRFLAVNGAHDLTLRLVDLDDWKLVARHRLGTPTDAPRHSPLTHGMASTHPIWLRDSSGVLVQDNVHEEVVLIGRDGKEKARRRLRTAAHTFLTTPSGGSAAGEKAVWKQAVTLEAASPCQRTPQPCRCC
jgi:hypothetical protein